MCAFLSLQNGISHWREPSWTAVSGIVRLHITCSITTAVNRLSLLITVSQAIVLVRQDLALHNGAKASIFSLAFAEVAELVDAHDSGSCGGHLVEVRVLSSAYGKSKIYDSFHFRLGQHLTSLLSQYRPPSVPQKNCERQDGFDHGIGHLISMTTELFESRGALGALSPMEQNQLKHKTKTLAEVFQRSSASVEGRNGYLSLRHHQLRGLDHPRKRAGLTAVHNFFLTRPDGTTAQPLFFETRPATRLKFYPPSIKNKLFKFPLLIPIHTVIISTSTGDPSMKKLEFASHDGEFETIDCYADENNTAVVRNDGRGNTYIYMSESTIRSFCEHLLHLTNESINEQIRIEDDRYHNVYFRLLTDKIAEELLYSDDDA